MFRMEMFDPARQVYDSIQVNLLRNQNEIQNPVSKTAMLYAIKKELKKEETTTIKPTKQEPTTPNNTESMKMTNISKANTQR